MPDPSEAGVAGEIGVIGPPGVDGYKLLLDGGMRGFGVVPRVPKLRAGDDIIPGLCKHG